MMKTSIKLKFRPSVKSEKEGTLYYQLIQCIYHKVEQEFLDHYLNY